MGNKPAKLPTDIQMINPDNANNTQVICEVPVAEKQALTQRSENVVMEDLKKITIGKS